MGPIFIDTSFLLAFLREKDVWHRAAVRLSADFDRAGGVTYYTTHLIVAELSDVNVVALNDDLFSRGMDLYRHRPDQRYSLADCISMIACSDRGLSEVLTADSDFEHEGFRILLKDD